MGYDINKLLNVEYLNEFIARYNSEKSQLQTSFIEYWTFDKVREMSIDAVTSYFAKYKVDCTNMVQYIESDFIDEKWEFADLFSDDINYSKELKDSLKEIALREIDKLNSKIKIDNDAINRKILLVEEKIATINILLKVLDENEVLLSKNINNIFDLVMSLDCSDEEKFRFSSNLTKLLIAKNKRIFSEQQKVDTTGFEEELDEVYNNSNVNNVEEEQLDESVFGYSETIKGYYDFYKKLMAEVGLGNTLEEIMELSNGMASGVATALHSINKEDFCIEMGALLSKIYQVQSKDKVDQELMSNALMDLSILDRIYEENDKNNEKRNNLMQKVIEDLELISLVPKEFVNNDYVNKIVNVLKLIKMELSNNLMDTVGLEKLNKKYVDINKKVGKIQTIIKMVDTLNKINNGLMTIMRSPSFATSEAGQTTDIYELQEKVLQLMDEIKVSGYKKEFEEQLNTLTIEFNKYVTGESKKEEKVNLTGFVLFDFDEQYTPYVISDLDPNNRHNLLDNSISQKKMVSGFEDYSKLIHDLLVYGKPELLTNHNQVYYLSRIMDVVYYDEAKNHSTGMVRVRPLRNSLVRFISKEVILTPDTEIYKQVTNLIMETLPNVVIDTGKEFSLFINFASSLKMADTDSYDEAIHRLDKKSPLYRLFFVPDYKTKLDDNEYSLFKDILSLSLDAYKELEKHNENLKFDIINQIGGNKSRG